MGKFTFQIEKYDQSTKKESVFAKYNVDLF